LVGAEGSLYCSVLRVPVEVAQDRDHDARATRIVRELQCPREAAVAYVAGGHDECPSMTVVQMSPVEAIITAVQGRTMGTGEPGGSMGVSMWSWGAWPSGESAAARRFRRAQ
jgi:hypothetical protein